MNCVNIKHPDFQKLLKESNIPSFELEIKVADWQEKNGVDKFPSVSDLLPIKPGVQELFESNPELATIGTQEQYSQYLESLNKPNTNPILQNNQEEQGDNVFNQARDLSNILLQLQASETSPDSKIESTIKKWLNSVGIDYKATDKIYDHDGNEVNAVAKADILAKLIEVVENKRDITTLPEEASHMLVRMLGLEHPLVRAMMRDIDKFDVYNEVKNSEYSFRYKGNEDKLREEAVGKLIAQIIVAQATGKPLPQKMQTQGNRVKAMLKWLFQRLSRLINTQAKDDLFAFKKAANIIMNNEKFEAAPQETKKSEVFYQISEEGGKAIQDKFAEERATYRPNVGFYVNKFGQQIMNRVTDLVKKEESKQYKKKAETEKDPKVKQAAAGGNIIHSHFNATMKYILDKIGNDLSKAKNIVVNYSDIQAQALKELKEIPELSEYTDAMLSLTIPQFQQIVTDIKSRIERIDKTQKLINKESKTNGKALILPEYTIYDDKKDLAGTIDLLVVYSNGKASIYDYKGYKYFTKGDGKLMGEFAISKIVTGDMQIGIYKDILRDSYGVEDFIETRLIPFNISFNNKSGTIYTFEVGAKYRDTYREYLEEVPVTSEKTGIKEIDDQLHKMFIIRDKLEKQIKIDWKNDALKTKLERIYKSIRKLQIDRDTRYAYNEVYNLISDFYTMSRKPDGLSLYYLSELEDYIKIYEEFFIDAKNIELKRAKDENLEDNEQEKIRIKYNHIYVEIKQTLRNIKDAKDNILKANHKHIDFDKPVKEISMLGSMLTPLSSFKRGHFKALHEIITLRDKYVREEVINVYNKLKTLRNEVKQWASSKGMSEQEALQKLINKQKNLIGRFNSTYYKEKEQAVKDKNIQWFLDNTEIEKVDGKLQFKNKEDKENFDKIKKSFVDNLSKRYPGDSLENVRVKKLAEWEAAHDFTVDSNALFKKPYGLKTIEHSRFLSEEWKFINQPENKPLLDTYKYLTELNKELAERTGREIKPNFISEIQKGIFESLTSWNMGTDVLKENWNKAFKAREHDAMLGVRDPNTNEPLMNIPLLYTDELTIELNEKEIDEIKAQLKQEGLREGTLDYENKFKGLKYGKEREKGLALKSTDLFTSALLFAEAAYTYEATKNIEEEVLAIQQNLERVETELTSPDGKKLLDKFTGKVAKLVGAPKDELEAFNKYVKMYIYGQKTQNKDVVSESGVSTNKSIKQALRYNSMKSLGLSWITGIGNLIGTSSNTMFIASEGKYFTKNQIAKAIGMLSGSNKQYSKEHVNAIIEFISPYAHNITYEMSRKLSTSKAKKYLNEDLFYLFMKYPDKAVDMLATLGILQNWGVNKDGKVRQIGEGVTSFMDLLNTEEDKVKGITDEQFVMVKKLISKATNEIKGSMTQEDQNLIGTNVYLSIFMQFRNWMPGLITQRFKGLQYEEDFDIADVGRFRVLYGEFTKKGLIPKLQTFIQLGMEVASFGIFNPLSKNADNIIAKKYYERYILENPELKDSFTYEQFVELRKQKLIAMAQEIRLLLIFAGMLMALKAMIPDDEEESPIASYIYKNAYRVFNRGYMELEFFFDPSTVKQILGSPAPIMKSMVEVIDFAQNTIDETRDFVTGNDYKGTFVWELDKKDQKEKFYYMSKFIPGSRFLTDIFDFFGLHDRQLK